MHKASTNLREWKTAEGIGLGSTEADVIKAYGDPSVQIPINEDGSGQQQTKGDTDESIFKLRVRGFRTGDKVSRLGDHRLFYGPAENSDDLRAAEFGIRDGKVSWIFLSRNE